MAVGKKCLEDNPERFIFIKENLSISKLLWWEHRTNCAVSSWAAFLRAGLYHKIADGSEAKLIDLNFFHIRAMNF